MKAAFMLLIFTSAIFSSCNRQKSFREAMSPPRVEGIPKEAFWRGGVDGGTWFVIDSIDSNKQVAIVRIYNDQSGEIIANKPFQLNCSTLKEVTWKNLKDQIQMFDGTRIYLQVIQQENKYCYFE